MSRKIGGLLHSSSLVVLAVVAGNAIAQQRTVLQTIDYPQGHQILSVMAQLEPGQCTIHHSHPGVESAYVLQGKIVAKVDGKPDLPLEAGQVLKFMPGENHIVCNVGSVQFKAIAHYIVEKDKPLVIPAQ